MEFNEDGLSSEARKKSMTTSKAEGMAYAVMAGTGDTYIPAAAVALGATSLQIGMLSALPQLLGALLQFFSINLIRLFKSRKTLVVAGTVLHALIWLPIIGVLLWPGPLSIPLIILFFSLGAGITLMNNPAWSSWISDIVPENERAGFFASRNGLGQGTLFISTFVAGLLLSQLQTQYPAATAFAAVFAIAAMARMVTAYYHTRITDVKYEILMIREIKLKHLFLLPAYRNELWFLGFIALFNFSVQFASPFFTPYMLNVLHYDIGTLGMITALAVLAKVVAYPYWAHAIDRFGNRTVLVASALMAPLFPLMWLFSNDLGMITLFNIFSGLTWAGFELSSFNYALALVGRELRPSFISKYNAFAGVFYAAGAIAGGLFIANFSDFALFGYSGMLLLFLLSGAMRMAVVLFFAPKLASSRDIENKSSQRTMIFNIVAAHPMQGATHTLLNGWDFTRKVVEKNTVMGGRIFVAGIGATGEIIKEGGRKIMSKVSRRKHL